MEKTQKESDYQRSLGRLARLKLVQPVSGSYDLTVRLLEYREGMVKLRMEGQEPLWLPLSQIKKARLELEKNSDKKTE
ncbi:hypothetical protein HY768_01100 [candidate division TA06 bacterium]|uniref:Ribosome maturation factor RimP C-terminal domain-containing protein n=1 Tax=candidate division TA06 bacterium TaxID=2250710 RepID=A0A933I9H6_UNCT6|nr:hypothetical protein [candidate division TA06 bacterium]